MNEVHVEAGAVLNGALMENDLIDELLLYMAPTWLGSGRGMSLMQKTQALTQAKHFEWKEITRTGEDLRLILRRK
jgi:diaminohydroxyphosphoribosylaminopyrimidine deaminase/5-amino-6-(5-phosphoribosylamino)uracil reductase